MCCRQGTPLTRGPRQSDDRAINARQAIFTVSNVSPDVFFVLRIHKVLQGDIDSMADSYSKADSVRISAALCSASL